MENSYLKKYVDKTELEKLKEFLISTDSYSKLLLMGLTPKEVATIIEEPFLNHLINKDVLERMDSRSYNYNDEFTKFGLDIEYDALAYACVKLNIEPKDSKLIKQSIGKMKIRKQ